MNGHGIPFQSRHLPVCTHLE